MRAFLTVLIACVLAACGTDGTTIVTGTSRPSTDSDNVILYQTAPANYETIGVVSGTSSKSASDKLGDILDKIKGEAADVGATGIIIQRGGQASGGPAGTVLPAANISQFVTMQDNRLSITGTAIYVAADAAAAAARAAAADAADRAANAASTVAPVSAPQPVESQPDLATVSAAAAKGDSASQYQLGDMYLDGTGVPQDYVAALKWYIIAKSNSAAGSDTYNAASTNLQNLESLMTPADIAQAQKAAAAWAKAHPKAKVKG
jgi:hypothetical protein